MLVACQWSRTLTWFPIIFISLFFLGAVFYMQWLRSGTDLMTCEAELHGSVSKMVSSILSLIGKTVTGWAQRHYCQWPCLALLSAAWVVPGRVPAPASAWEIHFFPQLFSLFSTKGNFFVSSLVLAATNDSDCCNCLLVTFTLLLWLGAGSWQSRYYYQPEPRSNLHESEVRLKSPLDSEWCKYPEIFARPPS